MNLIHETISGGHTVLRIAAATSAECRMNVGEVTPSDMGDNAAGMGRWMNNV